ncbi:preprotein translocase subunit SecA [Bifidobacterium psychraerophilum]|uniref:Protein translocase subunit SecA n=3 Tax=Bifidobacterium psychraerophilum TaxID=218140 RepID=A0A087CDT1_9BIFI|nr:preprotein translocase subunit SecA [Bifidobacterium psychraerophilum]KFI81431.1 protein translocase subunit secA [Bifidobacterium psychraerophilum]MCI1659806.1 preprotein translocase subunit SecA [Bifidobacterium psychraerophilum]MCI2176623.1 preprotein translocase subunit SecA [Bifidobacterium psychraerophilum]MCI2181566.1 preprotein translocase subunit SecA [Bifidobacterium psychraerophilum]PKA95774.1 protein translocase subunit secA [Bifidobacterium psychraerophilum DSM 22366]
MVAILDKVLRIGEGHQLRKLQGVATAVNALEDDIKAMSDEELKAQTPKFRKRIEKGESLDSIMPEAFATVREVSRRTLGQRHFDVQLMGGAALHWGNIAEMKTGEGKTLVATLPSYLNALSGKGVHVVTVNDYLASYQSELMGRIFRFLGMTVGCIVTDQKPQERRKQYEADITYGTNNEFGFDYLRDNMAWEKADLVQRGHNFAIVDEVDSILIDEARTPLIISGPAEGDVTRWYRQFARLVPKLMRDEDYEVDEKKKVVGILDSGIGKIEDYLGIDNLYEPSNTALIGYLNNAIKAKELFLRDRDYVVQGGEVLIVDEHTGRILSGRRYNEGLHQAIEAKESVEVKAENQTFATITLQNYFRMYDKLAGMTGTAETEAAEFMGTYKLGVLPIPTNRPMVRKDQDDLIFRTKKEKLSAIVKDVAKRHATGQPVLLGTASVESSEVVSTLLDVAEIPHQVLNAKQHAKEASVVAVAGRKGAVTVATNMAGRGTDIMLGGNTEFLADQKLRADGYSAEDTPEDYERLWPETLEAVKEQVKDEHEEVVKLGGMYVLGTERHESRRIDNQLRGRSGRQGDPGESRFYLSLEDDLMRLFNTQLVARVMSKGLPEGEPIESKSVSKGVRNAQKAVESRNFEIRKNVLKYDDVMNKQRTVIYEERQAVLKGEDIHDDIERFISDIATSYIRGARKGSDKPATWDYEGLWKALSSIYPIGIDEEETKDSIASLKGDKAAEQLHQAIVDDAKEQYANREEALGSEGTRQLERRVVLAVLDRKWREHLYEMDYLKDGIGLRGMGQRDPLVEYQREGYQMYNSMIEAIKEESIQLLFNVDIDQIAKTEDLNSESDEDAAVDQARESLGEGGATEGDDAAETLTFNAPEDPDGSDEDADEQSAASELAEPKDDASADEEAQEGSVVGPKPLSHAEQKVPANKRPKEEELRTPWSDGRTFPGTSRNAPCPCGSGRKYKMCHGQNE